MSHMINGRTYRDVLTTNTLPEPAKVEPVKLNQITSAIIPEAVPKPEGWQPKGDGFKKMITTHDEPKEKFKVVIEESKPGEPNPGDWIDKQFKADLKETATHDPYFDRDVDDMSKVEPKPEPEPKKKAGRPKKA
jgi:hypothetical protein